VPGWFRLSRQKGRDRLLIYFASAGRAAKPPGYAYQSPITNHQSPITDHPSLPHHHHTPPQRTHLPQLIRVSNHPHIHPGGGIFAIPAIGGVGGFKLLLAPTVVDDHAKLTESFYLCT